MERELEQHEQFDRICSGVGEFEPLPTVVAYADDDEHEPTEEEQREPLDGLILAGLVSPY
jgi:hypothetical protein